MVGNSIERQVFENDVISFTKPDSKVEPTFFEFKFASHEQLTTPVKAKRPSQTPEPKSVIDSAKKLCVSSSMQRDELISGTEAMQRANQELRQRLIEAGKRESDLKEELQVMLITLQEKKQENDSLQEEISKARAKALEDEHRQQEFDALEVKHKLLESRCVEVEKSWLQEKEQHKQAQDELEAAQRRALKAESLVEVHKTNLEELQTKFGANSQKTRQLEVEKQKLLHQLDSVHRTSDNEQESNRGAKEEVLVMKARFATAREAFHQMQACMMTLGEQIDIRQVEEEDDVEEEETQCVLTERFSKHETSREEEKEEDTAFTEPTTLNVDENHGAPSSPTFVVAPNKRWLLKNDSPDASVDDTGGIFESQDVRN
ncbi:Aste57867_10050 [Aphanomyces stellatus]|uniref:Aste57867_10050 protein n=1 Tax=Aphanomyces stellatus TaxID=120398 RepID=A0A485KQ15_9STRA|nr:hypothetical protein As57867_010011 [Aphanomyces stellatus]VFT86927.1 Aste57867_10050 [Aphanomyces stellatus]